MGLIFYAWARHLHVPAGRARRWMLVMVLLLPLATALLPGRNNEDFRDRRAWFDSMRILRIPLADGFRIDDLVLGLAVLSIVVSIWQEVLPIFRRPGADFGAAPADLVRRVQALPGWEHCEVGMAHTSAFFVATAGRPARPRLLLSPGVLERLDPAELQSVLRHENAHWRGHRWLISHALFLVRMLECYSPVALLAFRAYSLEIEMECDADAAAGHDPKTLARALLGAYRSIDRRDISGRETLRARVDALLGRGDPEAQEISPAVVLLAAAILLVMLPWVV